MSRALKQTEVGAVPSGATGRPAFLDLLPLGAALAVAVALVVARSNMGTALPLDNGSAIVLALILYICSAVLHVTHVYVREPWIRLTGIWLAAAGLTLNIGSWGIRWIEAGELENWSEWFWRYEPLTNLYDITVAFVFVAVIFTLAIERKPKHSAVGALTMPIAALLLMLAVFLGNEHRTIQPILDSYWRPIHVGIAAAGYGVCLVSFGLAVLYLIRDGVRMSSIGAWVALFGVGVYATIDRFSVFRGAYSASVLIGMDAIPLFGGGSLRVPVPWAGPALLIAFLTIVATAAALAYGALANRDDMRRLGMKLMLGSIVVQALVVAFVFWQVTRLDNVAARAAQPSRPDALVLFGAKLAENSNIDPATLTTGQLVTAATQTIEANAAGLHTGVRSNPIELSALVSVLVGMLVVWVLAYKPERMLESLPSLKTLDRLQYLAVSIAFPLLSLLLITGAVWANESWGRYWGWDNKEVGALVTWLAYAGYLHSRITHGWAGRRSAYFAVVGFLFVIFTYLGVSYLLPGLHSYAS
jgi:ABC-type transport system involved in cytochrome c biogenesis permease subunit